MDAFGFTLGSMGFSIEFNWVQAMQSNHEIAFADIEFRLKFLALISLEDSLYSGSVVFDIA